jgi:hypothetical protein
MKRWDIGCLGTTKLVIMKYRPLEHYLKQENMFAANPTFARIGSRISHIRKEMLKSLRTG